MKVTLINLREVSFSEEINPNTFARLRGLIQILTLVVAVSRGSQSDTVLLIKVNPEVIFELKRLQTVSLRALVRSQVELFVRSEQLTWHLKWVMRLEIRLFSFLQLKYGQQCLLPDFSES